ncbi:hypothetical protein GJ496_002558 [Pomphorhynchus laevis]|nr:hypothetical protein GJ496_002558 [Pomphorhynchus laevis]
MLSSVHSPISAVFKALVSKDTTVESLHDRYSQFGRIRNLSCHECDGNPCQKLVVITYHSLIVSQQRNIEESNTVINKENNELSFKNSNTTAISGNTYRRRRSSKKHKSEFKLSLVVQANRKYNIDYVKDLVYNICWQCGHIENFVKHYQFDFFRIEFVDNQSLVRALCNMNNFQIKCGTNKDREDGPVLKVDLAVTTHNPYYLSKRSLFQLDRSINEISRRVLKDLVFQDFQEVELHESKYSEISEDLSSTSSLQPRILAATQSLSNRKKTYLKKDDEKYLVHRMTTSKPSSLTSTDNVIKSSSCCVFSDHNMNLSEISQDNTVNNSAISSLSQDITG